MKAIINNKLYDTETATRIGGQSYLRKSGLFVTKNNNFFYYQESIGLYSGSIKEVSEEEAKEMIGKFYPEKYELFFGKPEEA